MNTTTVRLPDLADRFKLVRAGQPLRDLPPASAVRVDDPAGDGSSNDPDPAEPREAGSASP